ncbi:enoyl-CoA hydratase-related protein [Euzebya rosea]|uniref:enoyl-CoA hydratase-related protein n=1 Tax=Euzebya rosea TaxID=2052804 RepID=UPI00196A288D|nr:enoyl-CoA hydratase-related protein [Euzebya rosea]
MTMQQSHETLRVEVDDRGVATITMDRPEVRNAFNDTLIGELSSVAAALAADDDVRVVVLTGGGPVFSAGADLNWMGSMRDWSREENVADSRRMNGMLRSLWDLPKPLIGRVNGHAIAGGTGLTAVCDIVVAVRGAKLGLTEAVLGLAPAVISPYVVRKIGVSQARALFVTGELFDAEHAHRIGLVHQLVDDVDALDVAVAETVRRCLKAGPRAAAVAKTLPDLALDDLDVATDRTPGIIAELRVSEEGQEGIAAFFEKRPASWVPQSEEK